MRILCVAEKPSQAKAVAQILSQGSLHTREGASRYNKNFDFQYRVSGHFVQVTMTSVLGHLTELDFPASCRGWHSCNPAALFTSPVVRAVGENVKDVAKNIANESRTATHLYIWTDCDREGEGIGGEITSVSRSVNPNIVVRRAHFSSVLPQEIHSAMQNPRELDMRQVAAVEARTELDLRIGSALTRFQTLRLSSRFTSLNDKLISYGPCQFPTLGFVVDQFLRVENFVPESFWYIYLEHAKDDGRAVFTWKRSKLFDQEACFALYAKCMAAPVARVTSMKSRPKEKWRPLPLTTVDLQKCCSRYLRLAPDLIMSIAEGLYNQGFISYPRTETDQFDANMDLKGIVTKLIQYAPFSAYASGLVSEDGFKWPRKGKNNDKAHPPIHPVAPANNLSGNPLRVYEFVTRRFLACCSDNAKGQATEIEVLVTDEQFSANGLMILKRNYLDIYPFDRWSESSVPVYRQGDSFEPSVLEMRAGTTTAPKLLTDSDLIDIMDKNGIGTDATHADHIKKIIEREYIFRSSDKFLAPSTLGVGLIEGYDSMGLELSLSKPHLRCEMERELKRICDGAKTKEDVVRESVNLYKAVYMKSVDEVAKLEESLVRCLQQEPDSSVTIWVPSSGSGGAEVCKCSRCSDGTLTLRSKPSGGWMIGCNLFPQCKHAIWIPDVLSGIAVSDETCPLCQSHPRGPAKLVDVRFKPGSAPPGTACPYKACIRGCDEFINEMFDVRPSSSANRPIQQQQQTPSYLPASIVVPTSGNSSSWNSREIPDTYWDQPSSSSTRQPSHQQQQQPRPQQQQQQQHQPRPSSANNGSGGARTNAPLCNCQIPASRLVTVKDGPNKGRPFFKCSKGATGGCGYFEWQDQLGTHPGGNSGSSTRQQPPASSSSYTGRGPGYRYSEEPEVKPKCKCGLIAALREATKSVGNQGREYFVCTRTFQGCGFVCWKDEVHDYMSRAQAGAPSMPAPASATSTCYKCGQAGHWARDCTNEGASSFAARLERQAAGGAVRHARGRGRAKASRGRRGAGKRTSRSSGHTIDISGDGSDSDFA
ncbi:DNA topoisomerase 3-alpha [Coemansia sp. RSA 2050]|nr:DNA topoisomerase 3-alpha [Coemansia sp. RSA 2050]